jgi:hypothetical protein
MEAVEDHVKGERFGDVFWRSNEATSIGFV